METIESIAPHLLHEPGAEVDEVETEEVVLIETTHEPEPDPEPVWMTFEATAYTAYCDGCIGITKTGVDVRNTTHYNGLRVIAVDPAVIPLGSTVEIRYADGSTERVTAQDTGGAIRGNKIDILRSSRDKAVQFGRQNVEIRIVN
ncbi:3D domain-containing protein [Halalkalibacterium halodurans]|uniref:3D domain-containing protein n=1 Tax=Halalkalibacterium halodurans TaxID=86665 RepID=UPI002E1D396C|nr:3D domain-containing protein [Halalkalibacterium halodurans]